MADDEGAFEDLSLGDPQRQGKILAIEGLLRGLASCQLGEESDAIARVIEAINTPTPVKVPPERGPQPRPEEAVPSSPRRAARWIASRWQIATAAAVFFAIVAMLLYQAGRETKPYYEVLSGRMSGSGIEAGRIRAGSPVHVDGDTPSQIRFKEGSTAELSPSSEVVFCGPVDRLREVVALTRGIGMFRVKKGTEPFQVATPVGTVTTPDAHFSVGLRASGDGGETDAFPPLRLTVSVMQGKVHVDRAGKTCAVSAGQTRTFGPDPEGGGARFDGSDYEKLLKEAKLTLSEAIRKALKEAGEGVAVEAKIEAKDSTILYSVDVAHGDRTLDITIDDRTGDVAEKETGEDDQSKVVNASKISLLQAIEISLQKTPGLAVGAKLEIEGGKPEAEVKIFSEGKVSTVTLNGQTGDVLRIREKSKKGKRDKDGPDDHREER
jgi:uncharacterized membrane protein YkoI